MSSLPLIIGTVKGAAVDGGGTPRVFASALPELER